jgi:hypothetical protein
MNQHLHLHPLIPNLTGQFLNSSQIYEQAVQEMYTVPPLYSEPRYSE